MINERKRISIYSEQKVIITLKYAFQHVFDPSLSMKTTPLPGLLLFNNDGIYLTKCLRKRKKSKKIPINA